MRRLCTGGHESALFPRASRAIAQRIYAFCRGFEPVVYFKLIDAVYWQAVFAVALGRFDAGRPHNHIGGDFALIRFHFIGVNRQYFGVGHHADVFFPQGAGGLHRHFFGQAGQNARRGFNQGDVDLEMLRRAAGAVDFVISLHHFGGKLHTGGACTHNHHV